MVLRKFSLSLLAATVLTLGAGGGPAQADLTVDRSTDTLNGTITLAVPKAMGAKNPWKELVDYTATDTVAVKPLKSKTHKGVKLTFTNAPLEVLGGTSLPKVDEESVEDPTGESGTVNEEATPEGDASTEGDEASPNEEATSDTTLVEPLKDPMPIVVSHAPGVYTVTGDFSAFYPTAQELKKAKVKLPKDAKASNPSIDVELTLPGEITDVPEGFQSAVKGETLKLTGALLKKHPTFTIEVEVGEEPVMPKLGPHPAGDPAYPVDIPQRNQIPIYIFTATFLIGAGLVLFARFGDVSRFTARAHHKKMANEAKAATRQEPKQKRSKAKAPKKKPVKRKK